MRTRAYGSLVLLMAVLLAGCGPKLLEPTEVPEAIQLRAARVVEKELQINPRFIEISNIVFHVDETVDGYRYVVFSYDLLGEWPVGPGTWGRDTRRWAILMVLADHDLTLLQWGSSSVPEDGGFTFGEATRVKPSDDQTCLFGIVRDGRARSVKNIRMGGQVLVPHLKNGFAFLFRPERSPLTTEWQVLDGSGNVIYTTAWPTPGTLR